MLEISFSPESYHDVSTHAVHAFREAVNARADLQAEIRRAGAGLDLIALAARHGYAFTEDELEQAIEDAGDTQLSEFELEMVGGAEGWWSVLARPFIRALFVGRSFSPEALVTRPHRRPRSEAFCIVPSLSEDGW